MTTEIVIKTETKKPPKRPLVAGDVILCRSSLYLVTQVNSKDEFLLIDIQDGNRYTDVPICAGSFIEDLVDMNGAVVLSKITITF